MIWKRQASLAQLNAMGEGNMVGLLDIHFAGISHVTLARYDGCYLYKSLLY